MAQRERMKLIELLDSDEAFKIMNAYDTEHNEAGYAGLFGDNGGDPDGDLWLAEDGDLPDDLIDRLIAGGVAQRARGWKITPYTEPSNYRGYCGYTGSGVAYALDENTAITIQNDEALIEESKE